MWYFGSAEVSSNLNFSTTSLISWTKSCHLESWVSENRKIPEFMDQCVFQRKSLKVTDFLPKNRVPNLLSTHQRRTWNVPGSTMVRRGTGLILNKGRVKSSCTIQHSAKMYGSPWVSPMQTETKHYSAHFRGILSRFKLFSFLYLKKKDWFIFAVILFNKYSLTLLWCS